MTIDGYEYTLLKDYDKGQYRHLSFDGKVTYLSARVNLILLDPLRKTAPYLLENSLGLVMTTAVCAGISAAGTYLKGQQAPRGKDRVYFLDFVRDYMDARLQEPIVGYKIWAEWLYDDVRCGLSHAFAIKNGGIEVQVTNYLELKQCGPEIHPVEFLEDYARGWSKYLGQLRELGQGHRLGASFVKRFGEVFHD